MFLCKDIELVQLNEVIIASPIRYLSSREPVDKEGEGAGTCSWKVHNAVLFLESTVECPVEERSLSADERFMNNELFALLSNVDGDGSLFPRRLGGISCM